MLAETHAKSITLAKLVHIPITTVERLPALIQSITEYLESSIVTYTSDDEVEEASHDGDEVVQQAEKATRSFQHDENVEDSQNNMEDSEEFLDSDSKGTTKDKVDGHGEYLDTDSACEDAEENIEALHADAKEELDSEGYQTSSSANQIKSHQNHGEFQIQGRPRNKRAKVRTPWRFPIYQQKQVLLSPEPEGS